MALKQPFRALLWTLIPITYCLVFLGKTSSHVDSTGAFSFRASQDKPRRKQIQNLLLDCSRNHGMISKPLKLSEAWDSSIVGSNGSLNVFAWPQRTKEVAKLIPNKSSVVDFGAGWGGLRHLLPPGSSYTAVDLYVENKKFPIIRCDFNRGEYPLSLENITVIVVQGLYEYIADKMFFFRVMRTYNAELIMTYHPGHRVKDGWIAPLSEQQLLDIANVVGFELKSRLPVPGMNAEFIYQFGVCNPSRIRHFLRKRWA